MSLEVVWGLESLSHESVVVYLAVDCKGDAFILVGKWLRSTVNAHNAQALVDKNYNMSDQTLPISVFALRSLVLFAK
jgi:hypothetical protein